MITDVTQIKVTIPNQLEEYLASKASKFGMTLSAYIKNLIITDVKDMDYPVFTASKALEDSYKKAMAEKDQAIVIDDVEAFLSNL